MLHCPLVEIHRRDPGVPPDPGPRKGVERLVWEIVALALRKPWLLPAVLGLAWAARRRRWYLRFPFLPLPPASYLRWRQDTAYGSGNASASPDELERYLSWARRMGRGHS